jgi:hypothetical protein
VLVVELFADKDDRWYVRVLRQGRPERYALPPLTLVVRLWPVPNSGATRGSLSLQGDERRAGFQYSEQLAVLVRDWLAAGAPGQEQPAREGM